MNQDAPDGVFNPLDRTNCFIWQAQVRALPEQGDDTPLYDPGAGLYLHWAFSGRRPDWLLLDGDESEPFVTTLNRARFPEEQQALDSRASQALRSGQRSYAQAFRVRLRDGMVRWIWETVDIEPVGVHHWELTATWVDITSQKQTNERLDLLMRTARCLIWQTRVEAFPVTDAQSEELARLQGTSQHQLYYKWHCDTVVNEAAAQRWLPIVRQSHHSYDQDFHLARSPHDRDSCCQHMATALLAGQKTYNHEFSLPLADGSTRWLHEEVEVLPQSGSAWLLIGVCTDRTEAHRSEEELHYRANHDTLTGLGNRHLLLSQLSQLLKSPDKQPVLIFLDLDNFKVINDSLGHLVGDQVLQEAAQRLHQTLPKGSELMRLGGDEFTILFPDTPGVAYLTEYAQSLTSCLAAPLEIEGRTFSLTTSIGVAIAPACDAAQLLRRADMAMYQAKKTGKGCLAFFEEALERSAHARLELEITLRQALDSGMIQPYFQPILDLATRQIVTVEALARWHHPQLGLISPAEFIPIAEETGLILSLGLQILQQSCKAARRWHEQGLWVGVSVNVSAVQLRDPHFVEQVQQVLDTTGLPPRYLTLEITETVLMTDTLKNQQVLEQLTQQGIQLAIDDFGTGYSSMAYLSRLPVSTLKIDRMFVAQLTSGTKQLQSNKAIVRAVVALARSQHMHVTAEGIESESQLSQLRSLGCDYGQGFLIAKPLSPEAIGIFLLEHSLTTTLASPARRAA